MPKLTINDALGLASTGQLRQGSKLPQLLPQFLNFKALPLDQVRFQQGTAGFVFDQPIAVSAANLTFDIGATGGGSLAVLRPEDHVLNYDDVFSGVEIKPDEVFLALGLAFSRTLGASVSADSITFGLSWEKDLTITSFRRFTSDGVSFPPFLKALAQTADCFALPRTRQDLDQLEQGAVLAIAGNGELQVSGGFGMQLLTEQLAVSSPVAGAPVAVNASGSVNVELDFIVRGGYQLRLRRLAPQTLELSVYRMSGRESALVATAAAGIAAMRGRSDLSQNFIKALSRQPVVDEQEFREALPGDDPVGRDAQINDFEERLTAVISAKVEANLTATLSASKTDEAVWQFEIDMSAATSDAANAAIISALRGDFRPLTVDPTLLPAGIKQTANIFTRSDAQNHKLQVNLLGILNFYSLGKIARIASVERNPLGEATLVCDATSEYRLNALLLNGGGKASRLRSLLNEDLLMQATYKVAGLHVLPPEFSASHSYLELNNKTDNHKMKDILDVVRVAGLITPQAEAARLGNRHDFGRTTFYMMANYSSANMESIFLDSAGAPRTIDDFEIQGRLALGALLTGDDGQPFRKLLADTGTHGSAVWKSMKASGNLADFNEFFGVNAGGSDPNVAAAGSDFLCITSWAAAMNEAAKAIREVKDLLSAVVDVADPRLGQARRHLTSRMTDVIKHSQEHFGDPLGLMMVYFYSGRSARIQTVVTGQSIDRLSASLNSPIQAAASN